MTKLIDKTKQEVVKYKKFFVLMFTAKQSHCALLVCFPFSFSFLLFLSLLISLLLSFLLSLPFCNYSLLFFPLLFIIVVFPLHSIFWIFISLKY